MKVAAKAVLFGFLSLLGSLMFSFAIVPLLGGKVAGLGLLMTIVTPLAIGIPASWLHLRQYEKLKLSRTETLRAHQELANAYVRLQHQSRIDALTGLLNRQTFLNELKMLSRDGKSGALFYIDLDHFKTINDTYGHTIGDQALAATGSALKSLTGPDDLVGRLGGEEFALFKTGATSTEIAAIADAIMQCIRDIDLPAMHRKDHALSTSLGAIHCSKDFEFETAMIIADTRLYQAKGQGRNCAVLSDNRDLPLAI